MPKSKNKKIFIYFFLFILIGTLNNKNLNKIDLININNIRVSGLSEKNNYDLIDSLSFLKINNLLFLKKNTLTKIIDSHTLVEEYSVFKNYPSTLDIKLKETKFLAQLKKEDGNFLLGSNGKYTKINEFKNGVPFIFGNFENKNFFELKKIIDNTNFEYEKIKNFYFYKSGRWDIETKNGLIIKLPKDKIRKSLDILITFLDQNKKQDIKEVDLRQLNQIIING